MFTIKGLTFQSTSYSVAGVVGQNGCNGEDGGVGCIQNTTFTPSEVDIVALVSINGRQLRLEGKGPRPTPPADFTVMRACEAPVGTSVTCDMIENGAAGGYTLLLIAEPME